MNIGLYQSAASLSALERWQDAVSQNITASQVSGYKKRTVEVSAQLMGEYADKSNARVGDGQPAYFPRVNYGISFQNGEVNPTRRDYDLALQGEGFFVIQMPDGRSIYTRNGEFSMRNDRIMVGGGGEVQSEAGTPIQTLPQGGSVVVNRDGSVYQGDQMLGRVKVVKFADNARLIPISGGAFVAPDGVDPQTVEKPEVMQGYLEGSNITPLREMVDLVTISRAYEANQKMIQNRDSMLEKALDKLG